MKRVIIIGNGFDLAHGLKTSYNDFMEFIKKETHTTKHQVSSQGKCCKQPHHVHKGNINPYIKINYGNSNMIGLTTCKEPSSHYFKKLFSKYNQHGKWADLEALYFELIKGSSIKTDKDIEDLNKEFDYLKDMLENYLINEIENKIEPMWLDFDSFFHSNGSYLEHRSSGEIPEKEQIVGIINFNYTTKVLNYHLSNLTKQGSKDSTIINIHGSLESEENPIIFGYGDDHTEAYKEIQDKENNTLLVNFKTFQYLRTANYQKILGLLESQEEIRVEIIGHSCGLSDKTLLKTIFEHSNVKRIEYRYHGNRGNYFDNLYNMSRIFSDTAMMRHKLMSFDDTRGIPQNHILLK